MVGQVMPFGNDIDLGAFGVVCRQFLPGIRHFLVLIGGRVLRFGLNRGVLLQAPNPLLRVILAEN